MKKSFLRFSVLFVFSGVFFSSAFSQSKDYKNKKVGKSDASSSAAIQLSKMESSVVSELNVARKNPEKYIAYLEERRAALQGNLIKRPHHKDIRTTEGAAAIDEAIGDLKKVSNLGDLQINDGLNRVARAQLADLQENSSLGHFGKDGSDLRARLARFGKSKGKCGENICHNGATAKDVVAIFLVDDGVSSRMHRKTVINENLKQVGVACGNAKNSEQMCVVVFTADFQDKVADSEMTEF